jgi:pyrroloquinoline quinone biosynthesis protein E
MAHEMGAEYLELANTQYYSWAFVNRSQLLPTHAQLQEAEKVTEAWRAKLGDAMKIFFVAPDYHEGKVKKCCNGWGSMFMTIAPDGCALPCHTARLLPGLTFPNVKEANLSDIWYDSDGFNRYRGTGWMQEPCASCAYKEEDLGGCRCQAFMLTNDPDATDPVCSLSPLYHIVQAAVAEAATAKAQEHPLVFRDPVNSRRLSSV